MSAATSEPGVAVLPARTAAGLGFALLSAVSFGLSGALATPLLGSGWSPSAVVLARVAVAALVLTPAALVSLRGRWSLLRVHAAALVVYGVVAVALTQLAYFSAVRHMPVGPALLIEYTAPAVVVAWLWARHGHRPGPTTLGGVALCAVGLALVLDLGGGAGLGLSPVGVTWALVAMLGCAYYFVVSAHDTGLPPLVLAAGGLWVGAAVLALTGVVGVLPLVARDTTVRYAGVDVAWWVPLLVLGVVTAAVAYTAGIEAGRRLGSRVASFVALSEVVAGVLWAWLLLAQLPTTVQLGGGVLILAGVVAVRVGERATARPAV